MLINLHWKFMAREVYLSSSNGVRFINSDKTVRYSIEAKQKLFKGSFFNGFVKLMTRDSSFTKRDDRIKCQTMS